MRHVMRFHQSLLRLYPAGYRAEYRHELTRVFEERMRELEGRPFASVRQALTAIGDVVPNAVAIHWDILRQDLHFAARSLRRTPGFALTAVLVVALGVGANTAAFSLADYVLLRPLAFFEPERLVKMWISTPGYRNELSPAIYRDWKAQARSFEAFGAYTNGAVNMVGTVEPRRITTAVVTPEIFPLLGVRPYAGRYISPADSTDGQVAVLSWTLWQREFGGDDGVIGKTVRLDDVPYTVIGVMPRSFLFPYNDAEAWTPLLFAPDAYEDRTNNYIYGVARLRRGVSLEQGRAELNVIAKRVEAQYPTGEEEVGAAVLAFREEISERAKLLVLALCGAALCILLLACANLASLLLARATARGRELAVRAALGAGRERLVRQMVTESLALALVGGIVGVAIAVGGMPLLSKLVPGSLPIAEQPSVDLRVLALAAILMVLTGLAFGIGPAIAAGKSRALEALRDGGRTGGGRTQRTRAILVTIEVAASVVLLVSSGLLIRAVLRIQAVDPGFRADGVLVARTALPRPRYDPTALRQQFYDRVLEGVRALPGVEAAAFTTGVPMRIRGMIWGVELKGGEIVRNENNLASIRFITPQYFAAMGIPLREGRDVAQSDNLASPLVVVVSASLAERYWPNESAIGKGVMVANEERTIVGVAGHVYVRGLERPSEPQVYLPSGQQPDSSYTGYQPKDLVVRAVHPWNQLAAIRRIVASVDPQQPVSTARLMSGIVADETAPRVTQLRLLAVLSAIALLIAGIGIHGLLAYAVTQRRQELGIRRALGEQAGSILGRVLREGLALAVGGVAVGVFVAYLWARGMSALLFGITPADPVTFGIAAALCVTVAVLGCLRPAIRASRVDPIAALRGD